MNPKAIEKMVAEVHRTILRLRIACYMTDNGHMDKWLLSEIAFFLAISHLVGIARWPRSRPTALTQHALQVLTDMVEDDCRWRKQMAQLFDSMLARAEWVFSKRRTQ